MRRKIILINFTIFLTMILLFFIKSHVFAENNLKIVTNVDIVTKEEIFDVSIHIYDMSAASFTVQMFFDSNKLEYISELENANQIENVIIYTWTDENGGTNPKENGDIVTFRFRAKEIGDANFGLVGSFFDKDANKIPTNVSIAKVGIQERTTNSEINEVNTAGYENSYLEIMRIGVEGISPNFDKTIHEYFLIVNESIDYLNITAIPENKEATVAIVGNNYLKSGVSKIQITVTAENEIDKSVYTINVTKTAKPATANANLEILAVEYFPLDPEFIQDMTIYNTKIPENTQMLNILAIPQSSLAQVEITGNSNLQFGENTITITVTAENGITKKRYILKAYRKTGEEEVQEKEQEEQNKEQLNEILEGYTAERESIKIKDTKTNGIFTIVIVILVITGVGSFAYFYYIKKQKLR